MAEINDLNTTDASNTARFPENMAPSAVNDGARALEGLLARGFSDAVESNLTSTGSANAYALAPNRTVSAYYAGLRFQFIANFTNTAAATLNVSALGAKSIFRPTLSGPAALRGGEIQTNQIADVVYDGTQFLLLSAGPGPFQFVRKTATETVNNSTTLQNDDDLLAALVANETVVFMAYVDHTGASANADLKLAFTVPTGATLRWAMPNAIVAAADTLAGPDVQATSGGAITVGASTSARAQLLVGIVVNGANAGNLQLQWAQATAQAENTTVNANSFLLVWRV